jgi:hypothetical protein
MTETYCRQTYRRTRALFVRYFGDVMVKNDATSVRGLYR